jgi:hypothetical protein
MLNKKIDKWYILPTWNVEGQTNVVCSMNGDSPYVYFACCFMFCLLIVMTKLYLHHDRMMPQYDAT